MLAGVDELGEAPPEGVAGDHSLPPHARTWPEVGAVLATSDKSPSAPACAWSPRA